MKLYIYKAKDGWRWRLRAGNGRIVADGAEAYSSRRACRKAAWRLVNQMREDMVTVVG